MNATHRWLRGDAIPTQDKIKTLAVWLGVTPEWLRFGEADAPRAGYAAKEPQPTESDLELVRQFRRLNVGNRQVLREIVLSMLRVQRHK